MDWGLLNRIYCFVRGILLAQNTPLNKRERILAFMKFATKTSPQCDISCSKKNLKTGYLWISGKGKFLHSLVLFPGTMYICICDCYWSLTAQVSVNSLRLQGTIFQFINHEDQFILHSATIYLQAIFLKMFIYNSNEIEAQSTKLSSFLTVLVKHWWERELKILLEKEFWEINIFVDCTYPCYPHFSCHY